MIKLFLDDYRHNFDAFKYTNNEIYLKSDWVVVKSYKEFCSWISKNKLPDLISFDHDLADEHYNPEVTSYKEKTGFECAKWLVDYCMNYKKALPEYLVHSMNPVGKENIIGLLENYKKKFI